MMKYQTHVVITLEDRDIRLAEANSGLVVDLPPGATQVVIRVVREKAGEDRQP